MPSDTPTDDQMQLDFEAETSRRHGEIMLRLKSQQERSEACFRNNGVPARYRQASFDLLDAIPHDSLARYQNAILALQEFKRRSCLGIVLGNAGCGKSFLACALVNAFCSDGRSALYTLATDFIRDLEERWTRSKVKSRESGIIRRLVLPQLLVLDEVDDAIGEAVNRDRILEVVRRRHAELKPTLLVSARTWSKFSPKAGEQLLQIMREGGGVLEMRWPSLRGRLVREAQQ